MPVDQEQLQLAFAAFNEASEQLSGVYQELQHQVVQLTHELAMANGELHRQLLAKEDLSQQLSFLLNALPAGVLALNGHACIEQVNPAAFTILGEPLVGLSWDQVVQDRLSPTAVINEWHVKLQDMADQRRIRVESNAMDSTDRQILLVNDITEAYAIQEKIRRNQRLTSMGEMAANLAHQLRTPLSTALLYASHLGSDALSSDERQKFATKTIERLHHLEHLIKGMLRFIKGEITQLENVVISDLLAELQQVIEPQLIPLHLQLIVHDHSRAESVMTDHQALCGAMINLLENAMQASSPGDRIILSARMEQESIVLSVHDDGPGIDAALQERLFEPFFTTRSEGTGLGLAIVRGVIQSMGGTVQVNSLPDAGSEFVIRLPRNKGKLMR
ncbi:PAS domain-containing sensor histidine kinase [Nitrosomonas sp. Nm166]|uniref:sensor histidine kinase n=1 Tax=Nitrosomonas sp. Nm166 TaxID=1881054 RepID=UPI0008F23942|nr:ATP-binding protein [Nitrosomonas sp. Nm166]SFE99255.1 two-component system, sensor histidine kinase FlrB [Nitrosomonas sp. Nm166]